MLISIITSFYNSGKYIPRLFRSVVKQTYTDWEFVCVIDASPGDDAAIISRLAAKYGVEDKVKIIRNPQNLGIARSKKVGIDAASGQYLTFADGDDFFEPEALERMARPAIEHDVDYVNMNFCRYYAPLRKKVPICVPFPDDVYDRVMRRDEFFDRCFINFFGHFFIIHAYWAKLYRAELLKGLAFDYPAKEDAVSEDKWFNIEVYQRINTAYFIHYVGYVWRWGGISSVAVDSNWSMARDFEKHIEKFPFQEQLIEKYHYQKAYIPMLKYLKWEFVEAVAPLTAPKRQSPKGAMTLEYIGKCLDYAPLQRITELRDIEPGSSALFDAIAARDSVRVYDILQDIYRSTWTTRLAQRLFRFCFYRWR